jgi:quinolinate synthase
MDLTGDDAILSEIEELRRERRAIILVHNYQRREVQSIADYLGDSLGLARQAQSTDAEVIVFCGVHFMAETANILCPDKTTLLPEPEAGCPLADTITAEDVRRLRAEHPNAVVVTYVNSSAEVKAESDYCCTSGNAVQVVQAIEAGEVIFAPDRNLGRYVQRVTGRNLIVWDGCCPIHDRITREQIENLKASYPEAAFVAHPECREEVLQLADEVTSTSGIYEFARRSSAREIIIGSEAGMLYRLERDNPDKAFFFPSEDALCPNMKLITLKKVARSLRSLEPRVQVPDHVRDRALRAVERMVSIG